MVFRSSCSFLLQLLAAVMLSGCQPQPAGDSTARSPAESESVAGGDTPVAAHPSSDLISSSKLRFSDVTAQTGISFTYQNGEEAGHFSILESLGGGVAVLDLDRDGNEDLCFAGGGGFGAEQAILAHPTGLFRNRGKWAFADVSLLAEVSQAQYYSHGVARTDFDCDGFPDLLTTGYGGLELFHNQGDGTFRRIDPQASGLTDRLWSSSAAWADLNSDGFPDLYVAHYVDWSFQNDPYCRAAAPHEREICPPRSFSGLPDIMYLNRGDGRFAETSLGADITADGKGLGVVAADLDQNGSIDLYVANDTVPNFLFSNDGSANFKDASLLSGTSLSDRGVPDGSMGVDVCDFNNDGLPDLWVVNYERETSALYQNAGGMVFRHVSQKTGINSAGALYVGWGTCIHDFDLDGDEDLFVSNGHVIRFPTNASLKQLPLLFENDSGRRFRNVAQSAGPWFQEAHMGRGAAAADLDNDGDVDLAISRTNATAAILNNENSHEGTWLQVQLAGTRSAREPVGAKLELTCNGVTYCRFWKGGGSYGSTSSDRVFFGIPVPTQTVSLTIRWPSGLVQTLSDIPTQQITHVIEQPEQHRYGKKNALPR